MTLSCNLELCYTAKSTVPDTDDTDHYTENGPIMTCNFRVFHKKPLTSLLWGLQNWISNCMYKQNLKTNYQWKF